MQDWLEGRKSQRYPKEDLYLFCSGKFLVDKDPASEAQDYLGDIIMRDGSPVVIRDVPVYRRELERDGNIPWWAGDMTEINGYYIVPEDSGGNYCGDGNLGLTTNI